MMVKMIVIFLLAMVLLAMVAAQVMKFLGGRPEAKFCGTCGSALKKGRCKSCKA